MKKIIDIVFIMICLAFVAVPFLCMNRHEDVTSEIDNRKLVEAPSFGVEGFTVDYEEYLRDRIGFRDKIVNAYNVFNDRAFHELTHPIYTYGQDGYVFFTMHRNNPYGDYPTVYADMVKKLQDYCENRGSYFYFLFDPEKISVYRNYLPKGVNYDDSWVDEMFRYMDELGINYINNTQLLMDKSKSEQVFNKVYDAGHWNDLGMFYATNALWERIHQDIPAVTPMKKNEFTIRQVEETVLPTSEFKISELVPEFKLKQKIKKEAKQRYGEIKIDPSHPAYTYEINTAKAANDYPKLLMFQGSYYNRGARFIASRSSTYIGVHSYQNVLELPYYYNIYKPDVVVLDAAEYVFTDDFFDSSIMKKLDYNPSLSNGSIPFEQVVSHVKSSANKLDTNTVSNIEFGKYIDRIILNEKYKDAKYAYLLINSEVFDFSQNDNNMLELSLEHGKVQVNDKGILYIEKSNGEKSWTTIILKKK